MRLEEFRDCPRHGRVVAWVTYERRTDAEGWRTLDVLCPHCARERTAELPDADEHHPTREQRYALARARYRGLLARMPTNPTLRAVLELHDPQRVGYEPWPVCFGCDTEGHGTAPEWPCTTVLTIEYVMGS